MKQFKTLAILIALLLISNAEAACRLGFTQLQFGNYNPQISTATMGFGTVSATCDFRGPNNNFTTGQVRINLGVSNTTNNFNRSMRTVRNERLNYNAYTDQTLSRVWGDGTFNTSPLTATLGRNQSRTWTYYGSIPQLQNIPAGTYSDSMVITLLP